MFTTTTPTAATTIRIYTHDDAPSPIAIQAQITELAAGHNLAVEHADVTLDPSVALAAGIVGLPAITVHAGAAEIARRECVVAGRRFGRWLDRKVAFTTPATAPSLALA